MSTIGSPVDPVRNPLAASQPALPETVSLPTVPLPRYLQHGIVVVLTGNSLPRPRYRSPESNIVVITNEEAIIERKRREEVAGQLSNPKRRLERGNIAKFYKRLGER